jgi:hypothetical protein
VDDGDGNMPNFKRTTTASRAYDEAYAAHYATKDLHQALGLYRGVIAEHPNTQEAEYSRTQMHNIANSLVSKEDLLSAQVELAFARLELEEELENEPAAATPSAPEIPS